MVTRVVEFKMCAVLSLSGLCMRGEVGWVKKTSEFALFISLSRLLFISRRWVYISHQNMQNLVDVKEKL